MKRLAMASAMSIGLTMLAVPETKASGFIMIDPVAGGAIGPGMIGVPIPPVPLIRPGVVRPGVTRPVVTPVPRPGTRPVLHGNVSFGLHLESETIKVDVVDQVAKTYIVQTFKNDTDRNLAGTYLFPLPDDTTFSSFSLHIDGKPVEGKILEAQEARQQYEAIVRQMVDPGLLEYADHKTVRARIFPIPAHGTKKVELEYTQLLRAENGLLKYSFPLRSKGGNEPVEEVKIDMKMSSKQGLRTIWSPTHLISSTRSGEGNAKVGFSAKDFVPDKDFLLYYSVSDKAMAANVLTHKASAEDGYFLLTLSPPMKSENIVSKDIVLVADTSGSMQGEKMEQLKQALKYVINALNPADRFSLVQFSTDADVFKSQLVEASPANKKLAIAYVDDLEARGGTNIGEALSLGVTLLNQVTERPGYMVMMTDGEPTVGETNIDSLLKKAHSKRDIRIFDFGVGNDLNTQLLNKLAENNHGTAQYVAPDENLETALSGFYQKIKSPVLSDVNITYEGITVKDIYPRSVKDIFQGSQVLLLGKYKGGGAAKVNIQGKVNGVAKSYSFPLTFATEEVSHTYLPRLWAMRRIGYLTEVAKANGENREVIDEIVALSKKHGIISAYTSFLSLDPNEGHGVSRPMPRVAFDRSVRGGLSAAPGGAGSARFNLASSPVPSASPETKEYSIRKSGASRQSFEESSGFGGDALSSSNSGRLMARKDEAYASLSRQIAMAPQSGAKAVAREKQLQKLKANDSMSDQDSKSSGMKWIEGKTFYLKDGFWTDSAFLEGNHPNPEVVEFGSSKYFELIKKLPALSKFLGAGPKVIVVYQSRCFKIVQP